MLAHVLVNRAMKLADAATVAPLQYALLFWAVLFGYLFFGDVPRASIVVGAVLIMASGTYIVLREQQLKPVRAARTLLPAILGLDARFQTFKRFCRPLVASSRYPRARG